jgi:DNA-directed RNA polymerase subunit RPC12/RpoP
MNVGWMKLIDAYWTPSFNRFLILCDCGAMLDHSSRVSLVICPTCGRRNLTHGVEPRPRSGPWSEPVMELALR